MKDHVIKIEIEIDIEAESYSIFQGQWDPPEEGQTITGYSYRTLLEGNEIDGDSIEEIVADVMSDEFEYEPLD